MRRDHSGPSRLRSALAGFRGQHMMRTAADGPKSDPGVRDPALAEPGAPSRPDVALGAILLLQLALALPGCTTRALWLDEAYSAVMARRGFGAIASALGRDAGPPLYYFVLHAWRGIAGESEIGLRSLSLLCSIAATVLLYRLGLRLFDRWTARLAAALWACHPLQVVYAGEARNYTFFAALTLAMLLALSVLHSARRVLLPAIGLTVVLVALSYTHNLAFFAAAAALLAATLIRRRALAALALASLGAVACYAPWVPVLRQQLANSEKSIAWMAGLWSPWSPVQSLAIFAPWGRPSFLMDVPGSGGWWPAIALAWVLAAAAAWFGRMEPRRASASFLWTFLVLGLAVPTLVSAAHAPILMPGRTDFFLLPAFLLLVAAGLGAAPRRLRLLLSVTFVVAAASASFALGREPARLDEREMIAAVRETARPGDVVICTSLTRLAAEYYLEGAGLPLLSFPRDMEQELGHFNYQWYLEHLDLRRDAEAVADRASSMLAPGARVLVLDSRHSMNDLLMEELARRGLLEGASRSSERMGLQRIEMAVVLRSFERPGPPQPAGGGSSSGSSGGARKP